MRHLSIRSIIKQVPVEVAERPEDSIPEVPDEEQETDCDDESCHECKKKRQVALLDKLPHVVGTGKFTILL